MPVASALSVVVLLLWITGRDYPIVGDDFRYFIPRLIDTDLHLRVNGLAVQWYTPSFGTGLPAFPNPQHLQYSLPQALTLLVDPWTALLVTTAVVSLAGFAAFYAFLRAELALSVVPSTLGAMFFIGNGFYIEHLVVGHVGFQLYPVGAVLLACLLGRGTPVVVAAAIVAVTSAAVMYHAGPYLAILLALSLAATTPVVYLLKQEALGFRRAVIVAAFGSAWAAAIVAPKIFAIAALMRQFPREISDVFDVSGLSALAGVMMQLLGVMTFAPPMVLAGLDLTLFATALTRLTGASPRVGIWELDVALSPVLIALLGVAVLRPSRFGMFASRWRRERWIAFTVLCVIVWVLLEATLGRGLLYPLIKQLPILRSLHVNHRVPAAAVMPLAIVGAWIAERLADGRRGHRVLMAAVVVAACAPAAYLLVPPQLQVRQFDLTQSLADYQRVRAGERFPVQVIADVPDAVTFSNNASSYRPYEGIFGYALETFAPSARPGPTSSTVDSAFNMTHPASLVFPTINQLRPFDRIPAKDAANFDRFVTRKQPQWELPRSQPWLNVLAVTALFTALSTVLVGLAIRLRRPLRTKTLGQSGAPTA